MKILDTPVMEEVIVAAMVMEVRHRIITITNVVLVEGVFTQAEEMEKTVMVDMVFDKDYKAVKEKMAQTVMVDLEVVEVSIQMVLVVPEDIQVQEGKQGQLIAEITLLTVIMLDRTLYSMMVKMVQMVRLELLL